LVAAGNLWLPNPQEQPWIEQFLAEASSFSVGATNDQVDTTSQGLQWFLGARDPLPEPELSEPSGRTKEAIHEYYQRSMLPPEPQDEYVLPRWR
jgi:hypothetical protein